MTQVMGVKIMRKGEQTRVAILDAAIELAGRDGALLALAKDGALVSAGGLCWADRHFASPGVAVGNTDTSGQRDGLAGTGDDRADRSNGGDDAVLVGWL